MNDRTHGLSTNAVDDALLDRFFERQRQEIVARIRAERTTRGSRTSLLALAASALVAALLGAGVLGTGPEPGSQLAGLTLWTMSSYEVAADSDPLRRYGEWAEAGDGVDPLAAFGVTGTGGGAVDSNDTLQQIPFDWMIVPPDANLDSALKG